MRWACAAVVTVWLGFAASAKAESPPTLSPDEPLTLRPSADLSRFGAAVARTLSLRMAVPVRIGEPPPSDIPEAVPSGHVALSRREGTIELVLAGPHGHIYRSEVPLGRGRGSAAVRSVALAIEALRDAAIDGPPPGAVPTATRRTFERGGQRVTWIYLEREGGLFGLRPPPQPEAKPLLSVGMAFGVTEGLHALVGTRVGLGLCLLEGCLAIEGDIPLVPVNNAACDGRIIEYRPFVLAMRLSLRPWSIEDRFFFGFSAGLTARLGMASLIDVEADRITTDVGVRGGLEMAWRIAPPFEIAFEIGADAHVAPAEFVRRTRPPPDVDCPFMETILVEDRVTGWAALVLRVRP